MITREQRLLRGGRVRSEGCRAVLTVTVALTPTATPNPYPNPNPNPTPTPTPTPAPNHPNHTKQASVLSFSEAAQCGETYEVRAKG